MSDLTLATLSFSDNSPLDNKQLALATLLTLKRSTLTIKTQT
jgi:hypothetical protein